MEWIFNFEIWASLLTLTLMEIVLGIDNLVFLTIAASGLPEEKRLPVQRLGLAACAVLGRQVCRDDLRYGRLVLHRPRRRPKPVAS